MSSFAQCRQIVHLPVVPDVSCHGYINKHVEGTSCSVPDFCRYDYNNKHANSVMGWCHLVNV